MFYLVLYMYLSCPWCYLAVRLSAFLVVIGQMRQVKRILSKTSYAVLPYGYTQQIVLSWIYMAAARPLHTCRAPGIGDVIENDSCPHMLPSTFVPG